MKKKQPEKKKQMKRAAAVKKKAVKEAPKKAKKAIKETPAKKETKAKPAAKVAPTVTHSAPITPPATLGLKRTCPKCSTKFYDFAKSPILCPKCGAEVDPEALLPKIPRKSEKKKSADKVAEAVLAGDDGVAEVEPIEAADDLDDEEVVVVEIPVDDDVDDEF